MKGDPPIVSFALRADGSVVLDAGGSRPIELHARDGAWAGAVDEADPWRIERVPGEGGGFRLRRSGSSDEEGARTLRMPTSSDEVRTARHVLLEDGRLFRLVERGGRDPRFELLSWETPGAYLVARPAPAGWTIVPEASGGALGDVRALVVLMAMEILDSEQPGGIGRSIDDAS